MSDLPVNADDARVPARGPISLYVHVPFCASKCPYCDFHSSPGLHDAKAAEDVVHYVARRLGKDATLGEAFCEAVSAFLEEFIEWRILDGLESVYFGGGTPTVLGRLLARTVARLRADIPVSPDVEMTVETNPDTTDAELVGALVEAGVNRFSLGVQSFDDAVLKTLGRGYDSVAASRAVDILAATGERVSLDLMCGVPGQTTESWRDTLERAVSAGAGHLSVYPLSIERGTALAEEVVSGRMAAPDPDQAAEMMSVADDLLRAAGLRRYEVANYARPGEESRHNLGYWTGVSYLGVGPSAASMLPVSLARQTPLYPYVAAWPEDWRVRFTWNAELGSFLGSLWDKPPDQIEALSAEESAREDVMLGLRMVAGVRESQVDAAGLTVVLERLEADGLVERKRSRWRTTRLGWLLGNEVFGSVLEGE